MKDYLVRGSDNDNVVFPPMKSDDSIRQRTFLDGTAYEYVTKDSGERQEWDTGSKRDSQTGKPRFDLIPLLPLRRLADLYARGSEKYGDRNWEKGQPVSRYYASMFRHMMQWAEGDAEEDHLAATIWNAMAIMYTEDACDRGLLPVELDDWGG